MARNRRRHCPVCREVVPPAPRGRRARYCSPACRQKAYRNRSANPHAHALKLLRNDLFAIADRSARARGAVRVLEALGYEVQLVRRVATRKPARPRLSIVSGGRPEGEVGEPSQEEPESSPCTPIAG